MHLFLLQRTFCTQLLGIIVKFLDRFFLAQLEYEYEVLVCE